MADWNKLSPERFEQLCCEIIEGEGFYNIRRMGGSGDRGRDIIAKKESTLIFGSKEIQNWIIQCKRYVSTNLTIEIISAEINKVRMHNPDYYAIFITNTLNPNVHDWLEGVKNQYPFKILIYDVDWLEKQLSRQVNLYKRFFENQERNLSFNRIKNSTDIQIYTAGKMPTEAFRGSITTWRSNLEFESIRLNKKIGFFHPEYAGCDHTGINLSQTVEEDFRMISQSNLMIAYLEDDEQFGTLTEIMIAYSMNKQMAIFIDESITKRISLNEFDSFTDGIINLEYYKEVYKTVFKTDHVCPCDLMNELKLIHMNNYWFMIEFLRLRQSDIFIQTTTKENVTTDMIKYIKGFMI